MQELIHRGVIFIEAQDSMLTALNDERSEDKFDFRSS